MNQKTIQSDFELEGIGLHSGQLVTLTCRPAALNTGIIFKRIDLDGAPEVPANLGNVVSTFRSTSLAKNDVTVSTTEHLLSALCGLDIDNLIVEINGPEIPILDGSAELIVKKIMAAGVEEQEGEREFLELDEQHNFKDEVSGSEYIYFPIEEGETSEVTSIIEYNSKVGRQVAVYNNDTSYKEEIAPSRTFVFINELEELHSRGIIKGGKVDNAIVFNQLGYPHEKIKKLASHFNVDEDVIVENGILNGLTLKYPNEPARHKLLDLLGDLYLLKMPVRGRIIARRPGHTGNISFAKFLKALYQKKKKLRGKPLYNPSKPPLMDVQEVKSFIPHRYPFLLVDKIIELTDKQVVGVKNVTSNEQFFMGHFPDNPVFPGVLQMEALAQTGGIFALKTVEDPSEYNTYFLKMDKVKFKRLVVPGDTLILKMELMAPIRRGIFQMYGTVYVGDTIVSEGELTAQISKKTKSES